MALSGKLIGYVEISKSGDVFHDLIRHKPHDLVAIVPDKVHDCELHEGERGAVGSVITWHYTHDGKRKFMKEIIESVNEENHMIVFKVIGGELDELYKSFTIIFHVEPKGDGQLATWTFEFERPDTSVPYPTSFMDYLCNIIKVLIPITELNSYSIKDKNGVG
ncbi:kirola-like [Bidens hawaiensis]|uniref:kirola-like n=1 Tax=Bidens hawaiensis TaxID=980011 RepID=UPI004049DDA0